MRFNVLGALAGGLLATTMMPAFALAQSKGSAEVSLSRGIDSFMAEDYAKARRHFEASLTADPDFAAGHYFLGLTLMQTASQGVGPAAKKALLERALTEFELSRLRDPQLVLAYLDGAIAQTILGRFGQAESGFEQFINERPGDPLPFLFLAVVHYRQAQDDPSQLALATENLDRADQALETSGETNRSLQAHILFYRGLIAIEQNDRTAARDAFEQGYELAPDSDVGLQSKEILDRLLDRRPWELTLQIGYDYDTNITLRGHDVRRLAGEDKGNDWRFGLGSAFSYRLHETETTVIGVGFSTYDSWHTDITDFNVQNYGVNVYGAYSPEGADWLTLSIRYDWDHSLLGNQSYLTRHRVTPQIDIQETDWTSTSLFYQFEANNFMNEGPDDRFSQDGHTHAFGVVQRFELAQMYDRPLVLDLSYRFENVQTDGSQFDADNHIFALGLDVPLPWDMTFDFTSEFEVDFYSQHNILDLGRSKREDFIHTFIFALTKQFDEHLSARFQVDMTNNDSNVTDLDGQNFFSYNRVIYGLTLIYNF